MYWAKLSENFWNFAIKHACYIYNKIPHSGNNNLIPDEVFYNKKVNIKHLKTFGCVCYYRDQNPHKSKFKPNSRKGIFLRFDKKKYSYIVMDAENRKINYNNDIECIEEEPGDINYPSNNYQDPYFSFMKMDSDKKDITNNRANENNNIFI